MGSGVSARSPWFARCCHLLSRSILVFGAVAVGVADAAAGSPPRSSDDATAAVVETQGTVTQAVVANGVDATGAVTHSADTRRTDTRRTESVSPQTAGAVAIASSTTATAAVRADAGARTSDTDDTGAIAPHEVSHLPVGPLVVPPPPLPVATVAQPDAETATSESPPSLGVTYLNRAVFLIATDGSKASVERRKRLSEALKAAIEAENKATPDAPNVELVTQQPDHMELRVRGHAVGVLSDRDAAAARQPDLATYARALEEGLELFVADQRRKRALQGVAVRVAIALGVSLIGLFLLRLAQTLFARADEYIDERSVAIRPFTVLGVPVIGVEGLNALITFVVAIGRIATWIGIVVVTAAIALAQFDTTRPWIAVVAKWSTARLFAGFEEAALIFPRLVVAAVLLLGGSAAVRVARVLFDDATTTATPWGTVSRLRARVLRVLVPIGVFILVVPLAAAAVFGRFHTPIELVILALVLGASLGIAPLVASGGMGLAATWQGVLLNGDHITVGDKRGRIVRMNPFWIELEDEHGLRRDVPMLSLVNATITHHLEPAPQRFVVKLARPADIPAAMEALSALTKVSCPKHSVDCLSFGAAFAEFAIDVWAEPQQTSELVRRLADPGLEQPVLELSRCQRSDGARSMA